MNRFVVGLLVIVAVGLLLAWLVRRRRGEAERAPEAEEEERLISLVLLFREPRSLDCGTLAQLVNKAWGVDLPTDDLEATEFVAGKSPMFIIRLREDTFLVHNWNRPYVDNPEAAAADLVDLRLRKAMKEHKAWLSVDFLRGKEPPDLEKAYRHIGKLVAEFLGPGCLAIYSPATNQMHPYHPGLREALVSPDPLGDLAQRALLPITEIEEGDPRMKAAVEEARRRWPEFVNAFEVRRPGQWFGVKVPFSDGESTEFMWFKVTAIEGDVIHGILDNDPGSLKNLKSGDEVQAELEDLNDWMCVDGDDLTGGFTIKVLEDAQERE